MNRKLFNITVSAFLLISADFAYAETARVASRENAIRQDCRFFAPVKAKVKLNDSLTVQSKSGDWFKVTFNGISGCIHKSALEDKSFRLSNLGGDSGAQTSANEVALAGKGFNPQVEASYKGKHPDMDFASVDRIEKLQPTQDELQEFFLKGGLNLQ
jgi:hypothetical protein